MTQTAQPRSPRSGGLEIRVGAIITLLVVIGVVTWLLVRSSGGSPTSTPKSGIAATAVSAGALRAVSVALQQPIFWVGARGATTYELSSSASGKQIYVRYLPSGVKVGSPRVVLTVGTYAIPDAYAATRSVADRRSSVRVAVGSDAVAFYTRSTPDDVYEAFSALPYQIEVYSSIPKQARELVSDMHVTAVNGLIDMGAVAASETEIDTVGRSLGHPLYWLGPRAHTTYELTELTNGDVFVRYLPRGVAVGSSKPCLTVGTYPMANAYTVTAGVASGAGRVKVSIRGATAFYKAALPTSVFVAYKGSSTQIEVYDPVPGVSRGLVTSGDLRAFG